MERQRTEAARRAIDQDSRLIVGSIPGLVSVLTPTGAVEAVNDQLVEYCGQTLEELKQWGTTDTVHPDDLPEKHGGRLWGEPNDGPGATFAFSIPRGPEGVPSGPDFDVLRIPAATNPQHSMGNA